jgi:ubiquinol-cytochrome c reductase iron-sulfur subunit
MPGRPTGAEGLVIACFLASAACALSLAVVYILGGQPQAEGALLGAALLGLGSGLVLWAHHFLPHGPYAQERETLPSAPAERDAFEEALDRRGVMTRRRMIVASLGGALGALAVAFVFPVRSLGPSPGNALETTPWRRNRRAVTSDGTPVLATEVPFDGLVTVFPEGHVDSADGQVVLLRVRPDRIRPLPGRESWSPDGLIAYSKVCTHAGCPVGLFETSSGQLLCPCHQSAFDALHGADPVVGPAARALPQLPIEIDADGFVVAQSDFHEPIGPSYWNRP